MDEIRDRLPRLGHVSSSGKWKPGMPSRRMPAGSSAIAAVETVRADRARPVPQLPGRLQLARADHRAVPAVDCEVDAGHVAGRVGGEEDERAGELLRARPCAASGYGSRSTPSCR